MYSFSRFPGSVQARVCSYCPDSVHACVSFSSLYADTRVCHFSQPWIRLSAHACAFFLRVTGQDFFILKPWISIHWKCTLWPQPFLDKLTIFPDSAIMNTILFILWSITVRMSVVTKVRGHEWKEADKLRIPLNQLLLSSRVLQNPFLLLLSKSTFWTKFSLILLPFSVLFFILFCTEFLFHCIFLYTCPAFGAVATSLVSFK